MNVGGRKIGVLNIADKVDGNAYSEFDLELLHSIIPQFAVLIDRAILKNKAGELEQLSVTDELTGLLNLRYLERASGGRNETLEPLRLPDEFDDD